MKPELVAQLCHEANKVYCMLIGDNSQVAWSDAPEWQKQSAIKGVLFHLAHPEAVAAASHEAWLEEKTVTGWKYGSVKDPNKKEHPCIVPFHQLPLEQQRKDIIFKSLVEACR